eukprot:2953014-Rhodomonas_salina.1
MISSRRQWQCTQQSENAAATPGTSHCSWVDFLKLSMGITVTTCWDCSSNNFVSVDAIGSPCAHSDTIFPCGPSRRGDTGYSTDDSRNPTYPGHVPEHGNQKVGAVDTSMRGFRLTDSHLRGPPRSQQLSAPQQPNARIGQYYVTCEYPGMRVSNEPRQVTGASCSAASFFGAATRGHNSTRLPGTLTRALAHFPGTFFVLCTELRSCRGPIPGPFSTGPGYPGTRILEILQPHSAWQARAEPQAFTSLRTTLPFLNCTNVARNGTEQWPRRQIVSAIVTANVTNNQSPDPSSQWEAG